MANLFISYSRKDKETARRLAEAFKGQDLDFWIDWEGIEPTTDWWREIEKGIEGADNFLFLISPGSSSSKVCKREIEHAVRNGKRLIPIVVQDVRAEEAPEELRSLNWIFFREEDDFQAAFARLMKAIETDYDWVQTHRRLQVRALEWERGSHETSLLLRGKDLQAAETQLALNSSKEPQPTDLQRAYVLRSRQASDRQRRLVVSISIGAAILMAGLAVFGFVQARLATRRADIALARQLAAQAETVSTKHDANQFIGVLLAALSMQRYPTVDAAQVLQTHTGVPSRARMKHGGIVYSVAFSPDGKYVISAGDDQTARVWEAATGKEIARMAHDDINSAAFSPDGKYVVSAGLDGTARVWEADTGKEITRMTHEGWVFSAGFSPDGKYVVSAGDDGTARVWEAATGKEIARTEIDEEIRSAIFSPDGKYVLSAGPDLSAQLWEAATGKEVARMPGDGADVLAFSPDARYIISAGAFGTARLWEVATGKEIAQLAHGHRSYSRIYTVAFSADGRYIVSGGCDSEGPSPTCNTGSARVWEATTGKEIARMTHDNGVLSVAFSPDGKFVVSGSLDGTARLWEAATGKEVARMTHEVAVSAIAFSPNGKFTVSGGVDGIVQVWEAKASQEVARISHDNYVSSAAFSPDGKLIVSGSGDGTARLWKAETGQEIARATFEGEVASVAFSPDGSYVVLAACTEYDNTEEQCLEINVYVRETATGREISHKAHDRYVSSTIFSPDGKYILSVAQRTVYVWDATTGQEIARRDHSEEIRLAGFGPDGKYVVSTDLDGNARVWETATGKEILQKTIDPFVIGAALSPDGRYEVSNGCVITCILVWEVATGKDIARISYPETVTAAAFSSDGKYVVTGSQNGAVPLWEVATGKEIAAITHDARVVSVAFSPDGGFIVSGSEDGTARVWEAATGEEIARMTHDDYVSSVAFSPDGKYVLSASADGTARVWIWQPNDLIAKACAALHRNLTRAEWKRYIRDALEYQAVCPNLPIEPEVTPTIIPTP